MKDKVELHIIFPHGAFGASPDDDLLDTILREIAVAASDDPGEWAEKYGTDFENETFMMHRFCWCERPDCPWCAGCECPDGTVHYYVDGREVDFDRFVEFFDEMTEGLEYGTPAYKAAAKEADKRRSQKFEPVCDFCLGKGISAEHGGEPGKGAPHFWYKPTNFKVWWYKYIGRDVETNRPITQEELLRIRDDCLRSLGKPVK